MSRKREIKVNCPACKAEGDFTVWETINTAEDPEIAAKVTTMELFKYVCPSCGKKTMVDYSFIYQQAEDHLMYYYTADEKDAKLVIRSLTAPETPEEKAAVANLVKEDYLIRLCSDKVDLFEKLAIYNAGMDDRAIEIMKLFMGTHIRKNRPDVNFDRVLFYAPADDQRRLEFYEKGKPVAKAEVSEESYRNIVRDFISKLPPLRRDRNIMVNIHWAAGFVKSVSTADAKAKAEDEPEPKKD